MFVLFSSEIGQRKGLRTPGLDSYLTLFQSCSIECGEFDWMRTY